MTQGETIDIGELRRLSDTLFQRLAEAGVHRVGINSPYYWTISTEETFGLDKVPVPVVGDVFDDLRDLQSEVSSESDQGGLVIWHAFQHLSGLLTLLACADLRGELVLSPATET